VGRVWPRHGGRGRPLNSVVRLHLEPPRPNLKLASSAREELARYVAAVPGRPVIALMWTVGAKVGDPKTGGWRTLDPHWGVGFYDASEFPEMLRLTEIDGLPFAYGFDSDHLLDGGTLHFTDEKFHIEKSAI
jgi:hypothetical protein